MKNIFDVKYGEDNKEVFDILIKNKNVEIERIASNNVIFGEWYDQDWDEWVIILQGEATLELKDKGIFKMSTGDYLYIPSGSIHRVVNTSSMTLWLAVHIGKN